VRKDYAFTDKMEKRIKKSGSKKMRRIKDLLRNEEKKRYDREKDDEDKVGSRDEVLMIALKNSSYCFGNERKRAHITRH
jgi:hypothetical protein